MVDAEDCLIIFVLNFDKGNLQTIELVDRKSFFSQCSPRRWNLSNSYNYRTFLLEFFMDGCVEIRSMSENSLELVFYYHCVCNCKYEREVFNASEVYVCHFFLKNLYLLTCY